LVIFCIDSTTTPKLRSSLEIIIVAIAGYPRVRNSFASLNPEEEYNLHFGRYCKRHVSKGLSFPSSSRVAAIVDRRVQKDYDKQLEQIGVPGFSAWEYADCLKSPFWISSLGEKLYVKLLDFVKENYDSPEFSGVFPHIPLLKYRSDTHLLVYMPI
jgi:hypothetical protein